MEAPASLTTRDSLSSPHSLPTPGVSAPVRGSHSKHPVLFMSYHCLSSLVMAYRAPVPLLPPSAIRLTFLMMSSVPCRDLAYACAPRQAKEKVGKALWNKNLSVS